MGRFRHFRQRPGQLFFGVQDIPELIDKKLLNGFIGPVRAFGVDGFTLPGLETVHISHGRRLDEYPFAALVPGTPRVDFSVVTLAGRVIEELIDKLGRRSDVTDAEWRLAHAFKRKSEGPHVRDLARHQELQGILRAGVAAKIDQPFIDDLGACLRCDVAAKVDVEFSGDLEIVRRPGSAHGIKEIDPAAAGDGDQWIGFRFLADGFQRFEMHARETADDLEMAELFGTNIHQKVFPRGIFAVQALHRILHGGGQFTIGAAKLFQQHIAEARIRLVDPDGVHKFFDVMIHFNSLVCLICLSGDAPVELNRSSSSAVLNAMFVLSKGSYSRRPGGGDYSPAMAHAQADCGASHSMGSSLWTDQINKRGMGPPRSSSMAVN